MCDFVIDNELDFGLVGVVTAADEEIEMGAVDGKGGGGE